MKFGKCTPSLNRPITTDRASSRRHSHLGETEVRAETILQQNTVAGRQEPRLLSAINLYHGDDGSVANRIDPKRQGLDIAVIRDQEAVGNTTRTRDPGQIHARSCVAELAAGLSVAFVIQNHD